MTATHDRSTPQKRSRLTLFSRKFSIEPLKDGEETDIENLYSR